MLLLIKTLGSSRFATTLARVHESVITDQKYPNLSNCIKSLSKSSYISVSYFSFHNSSKEW